MTHAQQNTAHRVFAFETEFTPAGDIIGGPDRKFYSREETEQREGAARVDGERRAMQSAEAKGLASIDRIAQHLAPVPPQIAAIADQLRREAAELAMIAARRIAGAALDAHGADAAANAIEATMRQLKAGPAIIVSAAPEAQPEIQRRIERLRQSGHGSAISFTVDPNARPGDWRVEWAEGSVGFNRDQVEAALDAMMTTHLETPVESQLDLFVA